MDIAITSKFRPFTYDEMVKPLMQYREVYDKMAQDYTTLQAQAKMWENEVNRDNNPEAYAMYKRYTDDLNNLVEDFSKGMNMNNRRALLSMKSRYASDIEPIARASKRKEMLSEEQRKMIAQNPTMLYQRMANNMSLDDFINNPNADYGQQYSGALITKQVAEAAANIAKEARDSEEGRRKLRKLLPYQYEQVQQSGFSREAVMRAILDEPGADRILTGLVDSAINTSGVLNWGNQNTISRAYDYARQGLYHAIGQTQYQTITDQYGMQAALNEQQHRHRLAEQKHAQDLANAQRDAVKDYDQGKISLRGNVDAELTPEEVRGNKALYNHWKKEGWINNRGDFTVKGLRQLRKEASLVNYMYQYTHAKTREERRAAAKGLESLGAIFESRQSVRLRSREGNNDYYFNRQLYDFARNAGISRADIVGLKGNETGWKAAPTFNGALRKMNEGKQYKTVPEIDMFTQKITTSEAKNQVKSALKTGGNATLKPITGVTKDGKINVSYKGVIKAKDLDKEDITRIGFLPDRPGVLVIQIDGQDYLCEEGLAKTVLGESTYSQFEGSVKNIKGAENKVSMNNSINNAHNFMGRIGQGVSYEQPKRDLSEGTNVYPLDPDSYYDE